MLKPKSAQESFYGSYLYERIVPQDHLGSTVLLKDTAGAEVTDVSYYPYGSTKSGYFPDMDKMPVSLSGKGQGAGSERSRRIYGDGNVRRPPSREKGFTIPTRLAGL